MAKHKLAIHGGSPALDSGPFPWPIANKEIKETVCNALESGIWGLYESILTNQLIQDLKSTFQVSNAMLCSSGTIAVELGLRGIGVTDQHEVILAGYDFPGNFRAIEAIGARPVVVDVVENGWVLDPDQVVSGLSESTAAVIASHLHGQVADIQTIRSIVENHNRKSQQHVAILEDACQVPGGKLGGKPLGSLGDVGTFSFGGSKLLSAGRGGALTTNHPEIHQRAKIYAQRGNDAFPLSQLQAAVLGPQLKSLPSQTESRIQAVAKLLQLTSHLKDVVGLTQPLSDIAPAYYKVPWLLKDKTPGWTRTEFIDALLAEGVPVGEGFRGFLRRSPRRCRKVGTLTNSQIAAQQTVLLSHPILLQPDSTIELVASAFEKVVNHYP